MSLYDDRCYGLDLFTWTHRDMLILTAAGNSGFGNYEFTIGSPSTAKNALTIGASIQPADAWIQSFCVGGVVPDDRFCKIQAYYKATYNQEGLVSEGDVFDMLEKNGMSHEWDVACMEYHVRQASFSSLGPSRDGRLKPELVST